MDPKDADAAAPSAAAPFATGPRFSHTGSPVWPSPGVPRQQLGALRPGAQQHLPAPFFAQQGNAKVELAGSQGSVASAGGYARPPAYFSSGQVPGSPGKAGVSQFQKPGYGAPPGPASFRPLTAGPGPPPAAGYFPPAPPSASVPMGPPPRPLAAAGPTLFPPASAPAADRMAGPPPPAQPYVGSSVAPGHDLGPATLGSRYPQVPLTGVQQGGAAPAQYRRIQPLGYGPPPWVPYSDGQTAAAHRGPPVDGVGGYAAAEDLATQTLQEDFESLSVASGPGAEVDIDPASLARPSNSDESRNQALAANVLPRFLRLTTNVMPGSHSLQSRWHLPLGGVVQPFAETPKGEEVPVVNFGATTIVRCKRCRTYINPYVVFLDGGRRWRCNVCSLLNDVPVDYFCPLDDNGRRRDFSERPELSKCSVEFVAPAEYMVRAPMPPVYFFLIDVSFAAVKSGALQVAVETIKSCLDRLPGFPRTQIGFLTFDSTLHFHMLKATLTQSQMMVVADLEDPFLPVPDDLLVNLSESRKVVDVLLDSLPAMFQNTINVESALGPALRASFAVMNQLGGKLLIFQSTLPSIGLGRLKLRGDDPRIYGTDREHTLRGTEEQFYKHMSADFSKCQIGVNLYAFSERYTDLASIGTLSRYTAGHVYFYPGFQASLHGEKFRYDLSRDLTRETAWEAVMRIRCGKGVRSSSFHGHFMLRSTDLLALPAVDCDQAFGVQITLEDTLLTNSTVYLQAALLYTSSSGERRIRVHTLATPVANDLGEMYRAADCGAIVSLLSRLAVEKSFIAKLEEVRQVTQLRLFRSFREYRSLHASHRTTGRLIFPESLRLLPLYTLALCKSLALRGGALDAQPDERSACAYEIMTMPISRMLKLLYPSLYRLDNQLTQVLNSGVSAPKDLPQTMPLSAERLDYRGVYLLDDSLRFVLWVGKGVSNDIVASLLGPEAASTADLSKVSIGEQNNVMSKWFIGLLSALQKNDAATHQNCIAVRQGDQPREVKLLLSSMVEDRSFGLMGYGEWMTHVYRQVILKA